MGEINDVNEVIEVLKTCFEKIYKCENKNQKIKSYENFESHEFFQKIIEIYKEPKQLDAEKAKCSEVFADYVCKVARVTNSEFLGKIVMFVTLFRECLNNQNKKTSDTDYTEENNAEDAPDISNEFVTEYLETDFNFIDFQKEEVIDITQNFCQWLYDNNFTCSKLSLISNLS
jgi:hypothetical protein